MFSSCGEVVQLLGKVICRMSGCQASVAITHIIQVYREMGQCQRNEGECVPVLQCIQLTLCTTDRGGYGGGRDCPCVSSEWCDEGL